jgi:hypothetical protein
MTSSDPRDQSPPASTNLNEREHTVANHQVKRLVRLAKNFDKAVESLPNDKGKQYKREQKELADNRRQAQMSEGLLRLRVR